MRPLELRLRNFRSYFGEDTVIDFRGRRLVGIVGPIGSGKSSILDALAFALYGKTPTVAANTKSLIHQRADGATVALRFEADGAVWEAVRALRRKGQSQHGLKRLDADTPGAEVLETITLESDVNARIAQVLGLEFDAFTRSVLLAQGRFSEFLRSRPAERDNVLKGVFGHDRIDEMRAASKERVTALTTTVDTLAARLEHVARLETEVTERAEELDAVGDRVEAMRKAEPTLADLDERLAASRARMSELEASRHRTDELRGVLPDPVAVHTGVADAAAATTARTDLASRLDAAQDVLRAAETALEALEHAGSRLALEGAVALLATRASLVRRVAETEQRLGLVTARATEADESVGAAKDAVAEAVLRVDAATARREASDRTLKAAEEELHRARHADMAASLRSELASGEPCPVCLQGVEVVPDVHGGVELDPLEERVDAARSAATKETDARADAAGMLEAARTGLESAQTAAARAADEVTASRKTAAAATEELGTVAEELATLLGPGDPETQAAALRTEIETRTAEAVDARKTAERIRREHDDAIRRQQSVARDLGVFGIAIVDLSARLGVPAPVIDESRPETVAAALSGLTEALDEADRAASAELGSRQSTIEDATERRERILGELGIEGDFVAALSREEARAEWLAAENRKARKEIDAAAGLVAERDAATARRMLFSRLAADLTDAKFVRYLLDEERERLSDLGSEHFQRLSSGRYRFTADGTFNILDLTAADAVRKAESLSGGETFLASLALALALAEMVSRGGGRLEAFFLDEGFGTLDPEHLDLAMEGIETLAAAASRLVVIVSHVPELRHRLEDLIELDKSPVTGDTRVVRS